MTKYEIIKAKYPDKTPVIISGVELAKKKYLLPSEFTIGQLIYMLRMKLTLKPDQAIYIVITYDKCNVIPTASDPISKYEKGDFVRVIIKHESTFG